MERSSFEIKCEPTIYKPYTKATFEGFSRNFPSQLRQIIDPNEFDQIIQSINQRTISRKYTPILKGTYYFGFVTWIIFLGVPIVMCCFAGHKIIYKKFYKKITNNINDVLFQINNTESIKNKGIIFQLRKKKKSDLNSNTACDFCIVISYLKNPTSQQQSLPTNIININNNSNYINSSSRFNNNNNNINRNRNISNNIDNSMNIPIDNPTSDKVNLIKTSD